MPLLGIEAGGRLVDDDQLRIAQECLRDTEAPAHAAREGAELAPPDVVEVGHSQKPFDDFAPLPGGNQSLQHGEVVQQRLGRDSRVDAHLLRQVAQDLAHLVFLVEHVEVVKEEAPRVDALQRGDGPHQRRLPGSVGSEKAEHPPGDLQAHILQGLNTIAIGLRKVLDSQHLRVRGSVTLFEPVIRVGIVVECRDLPVPISPIERLCLVEAPVGFEAQQPHPETGGLFLESEEQTPAHASAAHLPGHPHSLDRADTGLGRLDRAAAHRSAIEAGHQEGAAWRPQVPGVGRDRPAGIEAPLEALAQFCEVLPETPLRIRAVRVLDGNSGERKVEELLHFRHRLHETRALGLAEGLEGPLRRIDRRADRAPRAPRGPRRSGTRGDCADPIRGVRPRSGRAVRVNATAG